MYCYNKSLYLIILRISLGLSLIPIFPRFVLAEPVLDTFRLIPGSGLANQPEFSSTRQGDSPCYSLEEEPGVVVVRVQINH